MASGITARSVHVSIVTLGLSSGPVRFRWQAGGFSADAVNCADMHNSLSLKRAGTALVGVVVATSLFVVADARAATPTCIGGVLATDPANDDAYAGQAGTGLESSAGDLLSVGASLGTASPPPSLAVFVTKVRDLQDTRAWHFDLTLTLDLVSESGRTIVVEARRAAVTGTPTGTIAGSAEGVTAAFNNDTNEITVTGPTAALGTVASLTLRSAETRYDSGAVLSPLADQAAGDCVLVLDPSSLPGSPAPLNVKALLIDTGVNGQHQEFGDGQIFGWWDFSGASTDQTPDGESWQDRDGHSDFQGDRDDPYDPDGHGSSTSSMLAGRNVLPSKTPSACPGCSIAVAKVLNENAIAADGSKGVLDGSIADAIRWGVDTLHVDVISVSIGSEAPVPRLLVEDTYSAISYARDHGVLVVFANGNGWGNAGVPGQPGGFMNYGNSTDALSVGADGLDSFLVTTDPEVVAVFNVNAAAATGNEYQDISGTSFSAPFTAGVAARLIGEGRACHSSYDLTPASIERLIQVTAQDRPEVPPSFEGYGVVTIDTMRAALGVVCHGEAVPVPDPLNDFYVTNVSGTERSVSSGKVESPAAVAMVETPFTDVSGHLVLGTSVPTGPKDAEIFQLVVAPGQSLTAIAEAVGGVPEVADFDMALFEGVGPDYPASRQLVASGNGGAAHEALTWTNHGPSPVTVSLVVYGWSIVGDQPFTLTGLNPDATRVFDGYVVADHLVLSTLGG